MAKACAYSCQSDIAAVGEFGELHLHCKRGLSKICNRSTADVNVHEAYDRAERTVMT